MSQSTPEPQPAQRSITYLFILAVLLVPVILFFRPTDKSSALPSTSHTQQPAMPRLPAYFISHGGPNIMYDTANPAYTALSNLGGQITNLIKAQPAGAVKGVAVVSAHWAGGRDYIGVQAAGSETANGGGGDDGGEEKGGLIYEYVLCGN